ncbi:MAG: hypothetical protein EZS28_003862 [Streblomastix strix]|uniref:Uncharacterized protein n=1 Tax=Streblomastix strix TaxID=222440 RepID=A0A5J4X0N1_9EUKA|nr:MAG: hypothetical protein EZS28_003862 [Streblomastix strix]
MPLLTQMKILKKQHVQNVPPLIFKKRSREVEEDYELYTVKQTSLQALRFNLEDVKNLRSILLHKDWMIKIDLESASHIIQPKSGIIEGKEKTNGQNIVKLRTIFIC